MYAYICQLVQLVSSNVQYSKVVGWIIIVVSKTNPNTAPNYTVSLALDPTGKYLYALSNTGSLPTDAGNYYACNLLANAGIYEST